MTTKELDAYFRSVLAIGDFEGIDPSLNGLQVDNDGADVAKIAFAVDACAETFRRAQAAGAGMLFTHHGLFWGKQARLGGAYRERLRVLFEANLALYAAHLPLDAHPELGNNAALAGLLGIREPRPFGICYGKPVGWMGELAEPLTAHEAARRVAFRDLPPQAVFPFGPEKSRVCAVLSGGAAEEVGQAIEAGADLYVTGEAAHSVYHLTAESRINVVAGGHYATEVWGPRRMAERCARDLPIAVEFIDAPTGL